MYAIVLTGGKQYKVTEGLVFETELMNANENETVNLEVLWLLTKTTLLLVKKQRKQLLKQ